MPKEAGKRARSAEFAGLVEEVLQPAGPVRLRAMFGGYGVYLDDAMFGLIADDVLYLKVDDENRPDFEAAGLGPFVYDMNGRLTTMSYHRAPEPVEQWETLEPWVTGAITAARRAKAAKRPRAKKG